MNKFLIVMVLLCSTHVLADRGALRTLASKARLHFSKIAAIPTIGLALATATLHPQVAHSRTEAELVEIGADNASYHDGAMLLRVDNNLDDGEVEELAFHVAYIGDGADGALLISRRGYGGYTIGEKVEAGHIISLYGWDGLIADNLNVEVIDSFEDETDGTFNVDLLRVSGLHLAGDYTPIPLDGSFPYAQPTDIELLTYRVSYNPNLGEDEPRDSFDLRALKCATRVQPRLASIGLGITDCGIENRVNPARGSLLLHDGRLVALQSAPTFFDMHIDGFDYWWTTWLGTGIPDRAVEYSNDLNGVGAAPPLIKKQSLSTTWGNIKKGIQ